ncbi:helix-turn-helix domain-containing protein [Cohnella cellulosilytica]|uniref:Helix-turn-helix domain-containing protein n=1 Tax=Cohnella cellulosilytica TaxID=986710 RepID=A0ABW2F4F9_9BACL
MHTAGVAPLQYLGSAELPLAGGERLALPAESCDRFGICLHSDLRVSRGDSGDRGIRVPAGELFHLPAGCVVSIVPLASSRVSLLTVSFSGPGFSVEQGGSAVRGGLQKFRMPLMKNWVSEFAEKPAEELLLPDYYLAQARLYALAAAYENARRNPVRDEADLSDYLEQTRQRIRDNYDAALDMEELARNSGVSASRFYKAFRQMTGLSPLKYLITRRLAASLRLLADPGVSVTEAAHSVGYTDEYYFSRLFKKQMGIAPTDYAARAQASIAALCPIFRGDLAVLGITPRVVLKRDWDLDEANRESYLREVREAKPDQILSGPLADDLIAELRTIAPLTVYPWHDRPWKTRLADFSRLLGLETVARRWLTDFDSKTDNARQHVEEQLSGTPYLIVGVRRGNFRAYGKLKRKFTDLLYDELHFRAPPAADAIGFLDMPDVRDVIGLDSDHVLFLVEFPADDAFCDELERRWKTGAERGGEGRRCLFIRLGEPFLYNAEMHERLVDQIVDYLLSDDRTK